MYLQLVSAMRHMVKIESEREREGGSGNGTALSLSIDYVTDYYVFTLVERDETQLCRMPSLFVHTLIHELKESMLKNMKQNFCSLQV